MEISRESTRRILMILGAAAALCFAVIVRAVPIKFSSGQPLKAEQLNQNFEALEARIAALETARQSAAREVGRIRFPATTGCAPATTSGSYVSASHVDCDSQQLFGAATRTSGNVLGMTLAALPPGNYYATADFVARADEPGTQCEFRLNATGGVNATGAGPTIATRDGPFYASHAGISFRVAAAVGATALNLEFMRSSGGGACYYFSDNASIAEAIEIRLFAFPS